VEGAEHGAFCGVGRFGVVDSVNEEGEAEDVGEENEFLCNCKFLVPNFEPGLEATLYGSLHVAHHC
jgi:hypothetical protein